MRSPCRRQLIAQAFFDDNVIELGDLMAAGVDRLLDLHIEFELTTTANGQGFGTKFIVGGIVPEPSTGLLLTFGLVVLARRRKRA